MPSRQPPRTFSPALPRSCAGGSGSRGRIWTGRRWGRCGRWCWSRPCQSYQCNNGGLVTRIIFKLAVAMPAHPRHSPLSRNYPDESHSHKDCSPHLRRNYLQQYEAATGYQEPLFSFDDQPMPPPPPKHNNSNLFPQFSPRHNPSQQVTARSLIEQNQHLRQQLRHSQALIQQLEAEVEMQLIHNRKKEEYGRGGVVDELKEELWTIYERNQQLEKQMRELKQMIFTERSGLVVNKHRQSYMAPSPLQQSSMNVPNRMSKSIEVKAVRQPRDSVCEQGMDRRKELIHSIRGMYFKVRGMEAESLKELWRWLKGLGQLCSGLIKWRKHALQVIRQNPHPSLLLRLLDEALMLCD